MPGSPFPEGWCLWLHWSSQRLLASAFNGRPDPSVRHPGGVLRALNTLGAESWPRPASKRIREALLAEAADLLELGRVFADYEVSLDKARRRSAGRRAGPRKPREVDGRNRRVAARYSLLHVDPTQKRALTKQLACSGVL